MCLHPRLASYVPKSPCNPKRRSISLSFFVEKLGEARQGKKKRKCARMLICPPPHVLPN